MSVRRFSRPNPKRYEVVRTDYITRDLSYIELKKLNFLIRKAKEDQAYIELFLNNVGKNYFIEGENYKD